MADYQTKQRRQNLIVGGFVIIAFFAFIYLLMKFRDLPLFVSRFNSFQVLVYFPEVPGVQKDTPVHYCGVQIGRVRRVSDPQVVTTDAERKTHKVGVTLSINDNFKDIPADVQVVILKRGLGSSYIELRDVGQDEPKDFLKDEMVLDGYVSMTSEFFPPDVQQKLENLVDSIATLTDNMNIIIGDSENQANLKKILENVTLATEQARETLISIQEFSNVGSEQVDRLGNQITLVAEQMEEALSQMRQLMAKIDNGEGTAGKLLNDGRLYENLIESTEELEMTLQQLKEWAADAREHGIRIKW